MERSSEAVKGFTLLDGAAMIIGAAAASLHFSEATPEGLTGLGWGLLWGAFAGIALTSAGPFLFLARRHVRKLDLYPQAGDRLWAVLGLPWICSALVRPRRSALCTGGELYTGVLTIGLALAILASMVSVFKICLPPVSNKSREVLAPSWTNRVGFALAVAWPLQCGYALLLLGEPNS